MKSKISTNAKIVYAGIWLYSDAEKRKAFPSRNRLSQDLNLSTSTIDRAITELKEIEAVIVKGRIRPDGGRSSNIYELRVSQPGGPYSYTNGGPAHRQLEPTPTDGEAITITNKQKPIKKRKRDLLFEEMCNGLGIDWNEATDGELSKVRGAVKQLRSVNATPTELKEVIDHYKKNWKVTISAPAISNNWSKLKNEIKEKPENKKYNCNEQGHKLTYLTEDFFQCRMCQLTSDDIKEDK